MITVGEKRLFQAIILQALMDAKSGSRKSDTPTQRESAIGWINGNNKFFRFCCESAEWPVSKIRKALVILMGDEFKELTLRKQFFNPIKRSTESYVKVRRKRELHRQDPKIIYRNRVVIAEAFF